MDLGVEQRAESPTPMESPVDELPPTEEEQGEPEGSLVELLKTEALHLKKKDQSATSGINYEEGSNAGRSSEGNTAAFGSAAERNVTKKGPGKDQSWSDKVIAGMTKIGILKKEEKTETPLEGPEKGKLSAIANQNVKKRTHNQTKKQRNWEVKQSQVSYEDGVTVFFHAILSKDFKGESEEPRVFIRAEGISGYNDWEDNICELVCTKDVGKHKHLIEGCVTISMDNLDKQIPYKYYVVCGEEGEYEVIPKESPEGIHVNRCLFIQFKYLSGTDWHQFDDIICKESSLSRWNKNANIVKRKKKALQIMLDSLLSILNTLTSCNVENFFQQFNQFYLVNKKLMVHEGEPKEWTDLQFDEKQQVHQWLWTIPVLHLFTDFEYIQENAQLESEDAWARLKGLPFVKYRIDEEKKGSEK
ncbi:E3 ubiquitin-protein ligase RNF213-like [Podarcis raffonei]|uniref:E3 ubiquitin-protein ligase RNF213-like n=1 Tax=Podarcis raffonei TaxID=65483 RepID=UPI00232992FB|nr:E3 ubiquitin-protein ligase RNF213-like [Podarcis raffonei]